MQAEEKQRQIFVLTIRSRFFLRRSEDVQQTSLCWFSLIFPYLLEIRNSHKLSSLSTPSTSNKTPKLIRRLIRTWIRMLIVWTKSQLNWTRSAAIIFHENILNLIRNKWINNNNHNNQQLSTTIIILLLTNSRSSACSGRIIYSFAHEF